MRCIGKHITCTTGEDECHLRTLCVALCTAGSIVCGAARMQPPSESDAGDWQHVSRPSSTASVKTLEQQGSGPLSDRAWGLASPSSRRTAMCNWEPQDGHQA